MIELNQILHADCMEVMKEIPDNFFELAIVDPPYGIARFGNRVELSNRICKDAKINQWDTKPSPEYFAELFRVSQRQIIWGANNFTLPETEYFIIWNKEQTVDNFASAEYAWTNIKKPAQIFKYSIHKEMAVRKANGGKIHPTQKPVALYKWLLDNYATCKYCNNEGFLMECIGEKWMGSVQVDCEACDVATEGKPKILDTHAGSCSSVIACIDYDFEYLAIEKDEDYFNQAMKRVENHKAQTNLFN